MVSFKTRIARVGWLLLIAIPALAITGGCHEARPRPLPPPPPGHSTASPMPPVLAEPVIAERAEETEAAADPGERAIAASTSASYEALLDSQIALERQRALFHLGLMRARPDGPIEDQRQARSYLERLLEEHPDSPFAKEIEVVLRLQLEIEKLRAENQEQAELVDRLEAQIEQLRMELETLKEIDIRRPNPGQ